VQGNITKKSELNEMGSCDNSMVPLLHHLSGSSAYEMLRESGVIMLPSQRTLRDYTYYTKNACGLSEDVDRQLMEVANFQSCAEHEKYVVLLMDEMHIKEDLEHSGMQLCLFRVRD